MRASPKPARSTNRQLWRANSEIGASREVLERWARRPKSAQALALRCGIVLAAADGQASKDVAARLDAARRRVDADAIDRQAKPSEGVLLGGEILPLR